MMLLLDLDPTSFPQESLSRVVRILHNFVKCATILAVESKLYAHADIFGVIKGLGVFQDNQLKNITCLEFHLKARIPLSFTERTATKFLPNFTDGVS